MSDEEGKVVVRLAWDYSEGFERFANDASVKETVRSGGMQSPPWCTYVTQVAAFPTSFKRSPYHFGGFN